MCLKKFLYFFIIFYDYHLIIKELPEEFKKQFTFLGGNTERYITFPVLTEKKKLQELIKMEKKLHKYILYIAIYW